MVNIKKYASPLGEMTLAERDGSLIGLWIEGQKYFLSKYKHEGMRCADSGVLICACEWLDRYFAGEKPGVFELPLAPEGTKFQHGVWDMLCDIPYGSTTTYGQIAKQMAAKMGRRSMSSQAVGGAVGHNPISIIIPCHRVLGADAKLTGYAGGIEKKIWLLEHEGVSNFAV